MSGSSWPPPTRSRTRSSRLKQEGPVDLNTASHSIAQSIVIRAFGLQYGHKITRLDRPSWKENRCGSSGAARCPLDARTFVTAGVRCPSERGWWSVTRCTCRVIKVLSELGRTGPEYTTKLAISRKRRLGITQRSRRQKATRCFLVFSIRTGVVCFS